MRVPLELPTGEKARSFLDYFNANLRERVRHGQGSSGRSESGKYVTDFTGPFSIAGGGTPLLRWTIVMSLDQGVEYLDVELADPSSAQGLPWEAEAQSFLTKVLSQALAEKRSQFFQRRFFHYVGPQLDGEYHLPGFRFAPVDPIDAEPAMRNAERVAAIDMNVDAVDRNNAWTIAQERANRHAARLSLLLNVGLREPRHVHTWVLPDLQHPNEPSVRLLAQYNAPGVYPSEMPKKGASCRPGRYIGSITARHRSLGDEVSLPNESRRILRAVDAAQPEIREAFDGAARLYQASCILAEHYPSAGLAYRVAAAEAASKGDATIQGFSAFVRKYTANTDDRDAVLNYLYGDVRSSHLHSGRFPLGEFERFHWFDMLGDPIAQEKRSFHFDCFSIVRDALVNWIVSLLPREIPQTEKTERS